MPLPTLYAQVGRHQQRELRRQHGHEHLQGAAGAFLAFTVLSAACRLPALRSAAYRTMLHSCCFAALRFPPARSP